MIVILVFLAALMFLFVGWLVSQSIGVQPWVASTGAAEIPTRGIQAQPNSKVALVVLIAVLTSVFALTISAYLIRMELADWRPLPEPHLLWINTAVLALASVGMHRAFLKAGRQDRARTMGGLIFAGICLILFVFGQMLAWQQLRGLGYFAASNPANAFFYLVTGLHVVHILGGLIAWGCTMRKAMGSTEIAEAQLMVQLAGIYIHFLLVVWLVLFALLLRT
jgi:cytochrome c oxidase subunit 3